MRRGDDLEFSEIPALPSPYWGRREMEVRPGLGLPIRIASIGDPTDGGCLIGVQPAWESWQFRTELDFRAAVFDLLGAAKQAGFLDRSSCVLIPEMTGLQLLLVDEFPWATLSPSWRQACLTALCDEKAWRLAMALAKVKRLSWEKALFLELVTAKLSRALEAFVSAFSIAARDFETTIFTGTMIMPRKASVTESGLSWPRSFNPESELAAGGLLVHPSGELDKQISWKKGPTPFESSLFLHEGPREPVLYDTPLGRMAVVLGEDAWQPDAAGLCAGADIVAAPSLRWAGDHRSEWNQQGINNWIHLTPAKFGMTFFNRSGLFERRSLGEPMAVHHGAFTTLTEAAREGPESTILGMWLSADRSLPPRESLPPSLA